MKPDNIDRKILTALQQDGRLQNIELAKQVGLSPSSCLRRVKLLEEAGIIERYSAKLSAEKIGLGFTVFARIWLKSQDGETVRQFTEAVCRLKQITECHLMAGDSDFLLRIVTADLQAYWRFHTDYLARLPGVQNIRTDIPLLVVKSDTDLPLQA
ncbi:Lrp/AsnC family transcriptional regulator [Neisseria animalis]|uniref:Lrp/AsnC family transcriptional regulator n=1 Tax=Neisseria animalis TaxID=492 RepID=A0A5P3MNY0_NEIAN|nr:Lrp/AsnC family transcriptional regulator [Neisseria animalis]QEY23252.1 Lrp/AsnC family transcriptional regulator [Neisseria animalis]ROW31991.1 Lrp/AsnC family transcriptional regulator [Neisseria animalis]VEE08517.1 leucine-responsive regulatory protein [Neisseria animalis]